MYCFQSGVSLVARLRRFGIDMRIVLFNLLRHVQRRGTLYRILRAVVADVVLGSVDGAVVGLVMAFVTGSVTGLVVASVTGWLVMMAEGVDTDVIGSTSPT